VSKVVPIRGRELIPVLEDWLERAKQGEILALAFAAVLVDEACAEGWAGDVDNCAVTLYGAINVMRDGYFHQNIEHYS
jgi:hypothetical protein